MKRLLALLIFLPCVANAQAILGALPFQPEGQGTATISCSNSSTATAVPKAIANAAGSGNQLGQIEVQNAGTVVVFVEEGTSSGVTAAVASGYPILPGQSKVVSAGTAVTHIACISGSGTQTVYITVGKGN